MELDDGDIHPIQLKPLLVSSLLCSVLFFSSVLLAAAAATATLSHYSTLPLKARKKGEKKSKKKFIETATCGCGADKANEKKFGGSWR